MLGPFSLNVLPSLNAGLNAASALFLIAGVLFIRRRDVARHTLCMAAAFLASTLFLISYLAYHWIHGSQRFQGVGWVRPVYFTILISHTVLAVAIVPLVLRTLFQAIRNRLAEHARLARWTFPLWLYVSLTGIIVYLMLYQTGTAWACPSCKEAVSSQGEALTQGWARSILLLMATPYLLFAGVTFAIVRAFRQAHPKR